MVPALEAALAPPFVPFFETLDGLHFVWLLGFNGLFFFGVNLDTVLRAIVLGMLKEKGHYHRFP